MRICFDGKTPFGNFVRLADQSPATLDIELLHNGTYIQID